MMWLFVTLGVAVGLAVVAGLVVLYGQLFRAACWTYNRFWSSAAVLVAPLPAEPVNESGRADATYRTTPAGPYTSPATYEDAAPGTADDIAPDAVPVPNLVRALFVVLVSLGIAYAAAGLTIVLCICPQFFQSHPLEVHPAAIALAWVAALPAGMTMMSLLLPTTFLRAIWVSLIYLGYAIAGYAGVCVFFWLVVGSIFGIGQVARWANGMP